MANELNVGTPSGANVYAVVRREDGTVWNGVTFVTWNNPDVATYAVALTDRGGDYYSADFPVAITTPGQYFVSYYLRGGTLPANTDFKLPADETIDWLGSPSEPTTHYITLTQVFLEGGTSNARLKADLENEGFSSDIDPMLEDILDAGDSGVDLKLLSASPPAVLPLDLNTVTDARTVRDIRRAARKYAWADLEDKREQQQSGTPTPTAGDKKRAAADAIMDALIAAGLPGITTVTVDTTPPPGTFEFVPVRRDACDVTADENFRPVLWY